MQLSNFIIENLKEFDYIYELFYKKENYKNEKISIYWSDFVSDICHKK
jgi:hypothetical protein